MLFWFCMILIWPYYLDFIVWLAIIWFGFCHTWRTIAPPPLFSMFWGHRNSALFCSRVWPSDEAEMHDRYTSKNGFEINSRGNSSNIFFQMFLCRCLVDTCLVISDCVWQPKEVVNALVLFCPCKSLTVEQWQSSFMACGPVQMWCSYFKNSKTWGMFIQRSYVIVLLQHDFTI